jgi:hypothetical protein
MLYRNQENFKSVVLSLSTCPEKKTRNRLPMLAGLLYVFSIGIILNALSMQILYGTSMGQQKKLYWHSGT